MKELKIRRSGFEVGETKIASLFGWWFISGKKK